MSALASVNQRIQDWSAGPYDRLQASLEGLSSRDRRMLFGLIAFFLFGLFGGSAWWMNATLSGAQNTLEEHAGTLSFIKTLGEEQEGAMVQLESVQGEIAKYQGTDLSAFLEKAAQSAQIKDQLDSVQPTTSTENGFLEQRNYDVSLKKVSLEQFLNFLWTVETDGYPLQILSTQMKTAKSGGEKVLNVKLEIAAFRILEEE